MELTITLICKDCSHQYGRWRPRCPACGTPKPVEEIRREVKLTTKQRERKPRMIKKPCAMCGLGGAKRLCLVCGASLHRHCLTVHERRCKFEFVSCEDVGKEHDFIEQPGEPPVDVCNQCGKEQR